MEHSARIFVAGYCGMVGSALVQRLQGGGFAHVIARSQAELDLLDQRAVNDFLPVEKPDLLDLWSATKDLMLPLRRAQKFFYCPLKDNRKVVESGGESPYTAASDLQWSEQDEVKEKPIKFYGFP